MHVAKSLAMQVMFMKIINIYYFLSTSEMLADVAKF